MKDRICALTLNPAIDKTVYVDDFQCDRVNRVKSFCQIPGSKGINIARILAKCELESVCSGFIGGENGQYVLNSIRNDGVIDDFVRVDYDTRTNIKLVDLKNGTYTDINFDGGTPTDAQIEALKKKTAQLAAESRLVAIGGSIPPGISASIYYDLAQIAQRAGARVSLDCYNEPLLYALHARPFVIKPNLYEMESTFHQKLDSIQDVVRAACKLHREGVENVLVSLGKEGAVAVCSGRVYRIYTCAVPVYNTVGAGDAFLSGFIYGWCKGLDCVACLRLSASFSQSVVSSKADKAKSLAELVQYTNDIVVEEITKDMM